MESSNMNEKNSSNLSYINAYYAYLDIYYDNFTDKNGILFNDKKFFEMSELPESFVKNFINFLNRKTHNRIKRKKKFMECFFVLFNSYILKDKEEIIKFLFNIFKKDNENNVPLMSILTIMKDILIYLLIKAKNYNMETFLTLKYRLFLIIHNCFRGKNTLKYEEMKKYLLRNPLSLRIIQFLFHSVSPVSYELIKYINKFLTGNRLDNKEHLFKLEKNYKLNINYLTEKFKYVADYYEEGDCNFNFIEEICNIEDHNKKEKPNKYKFNGSRDLFNLFKSKSRDHSNFLRSLDYNIIKKPRVITHYELDKKRYLPENFKKINEFKVEKMYETIEIFQNKIRFPNINITKLDSLLLDNISRIQKVNKHSKKIITCFYYSNFDFEDFWEIENSVKFSYQEKSYIRVVNKTILFYILKDTDEHVDSSNLRNMILLKGIKKIWIKRSNDNYFVSLKQEENFNCHNFVFFNFEELFKFYFILKNNGIFEKLEDKNTLKETLEYKEIFEITIDKEEILKKMIKAYQDNSLRSVCKSLIINFLDDSCTLSKGNIEKLLYFERIIELSDFKKVLITLQN